VYRRFSIAQWTPNQRLFFPNRDLVPRGELTSGLGFTVEKVESFALQLTVAGYSPWRGPAPSA
jgi:hypothetical protein